MSPPIFFGTPEGENTSGFAYAENIPTTSDRKLELILRATAIFISELYFSNQFNNALREARPFLASFWLSAGIMFYLVGTQSTEWFESMSIRPAGEKG